MTYGSLAFSPRDIVLTPRPSRLRNMFARLFGAMMVSRQRRANHEILRYLAARHQFSVSSGGLFHLKPNVRCRLCVPIN